MTDDLRISTMTCCTSLINNYGENIKINLKPLLNNVNISSDFIQFIQTDHGMRGDCEKLNKKRRKNPNKRQTFMNQATIIISVPEKIKPINLKLFINGKIGCTGLLSQEMLKNCLEKLINYVNDIDKNFCDEDKIFNCRDVKINNIKTCLINSDFSLPFKVSREKIFDDLIEDDYNVHYNPDSYPGVKIQYFYNPGLNTNGICNCNVMCDGSGCGSGTHGDCDKVTSAIFMSGRCLITGAKTFEEIKIVHKFITSYINEKKENYIL